MSGVRPGRTRAANVGNGDHRHAVAGRMALVTGGGRGIGRAIPLGLPGMGARVAVLARSANELAAVDTDMQAWIRSQDPALVGAELHQRFVDDHKRGRLLTGEESTASLLPRLGSSQSGQIWDASDSAPLAPAVATARHTSLVRRTP